MHHIQTHTYLPGLYISQEYKHTWGCNSDTTEQMLNGGKEMSGILQDERKTEKKYIYKKKNLVKLNDDNMARVQE